jgi:hypothetical protein
MHSEFKSVKEVLDIIEESTSPPTLDKTERGDHPQIVSFSDSIVRVRTIESEENKKYPTGILFQELLSLVHAQVELIDFGIIIRGGITIGDIYISGSRVFGTGLVGAYVLESKYSIYPRVIIDPKLIYEYKNNKLLQAKWHSLEDEQEYVADLLKQGDDGMWFVDYARACSTEFDEPEMYFNFLYRHRKVILDGANKHKELNAVLSKFVWMANYHNQIISTIETDSFEEYDLRKKDFFISSEEIPTLQYVET